MTRRHMRYTASSPPSALALPVADRADDIAPGHWLLARLDKRVLRPGGIALTRALLTGAAVTDADVIEFAPGLGRTAAEILDRRPRSYLGVEQDPDAAQAAARVADQDNVRVADAADTGLPHADADVVVGEAMLTMQGGAAKEAIVAEAVRLLRPGGRYAIHELALIPDTVAEHIKADVRQGFARAIRLNARPLTIAEWRKLLTAHGLVVEEVLTAPMALLSPRRLVADEGAWGAARFVVKVLSRPEARRRVLDMRRTFRRHRAYLAAVALIARKPDPGMTG